MLIEGVERNHNSNYHAEYKTTSCVLEVYSIYVRWGSSVLLVSDQGEQKIQL